MSRNYVKTQNTWERIEFDDYQGKSEVYASPKAELVAKSKDIETLDLSLSTGTYVVGKEGVIPQEDISKVIDFSRISNSADNAANGIYIGVNEKYWGDQANLTYRIIDDKCAVLISEEGTPLGYTTLNALNLEHIAKNSSTNAINDLREETIDINKNSKNSNNTSTTKTNKPNNQQSDGSSIGPIAGATAGLSTASLGKETREVKQASAAERAAEKSKKQIEANSQVAYNPREDLTVNSQAVDTQTTVNGEVAERRKVDYTDAEVYYMAQLVENEAGSSGTTGQVAIAEEIRNRVLSEDPYYKNTVKGVLDQGYLPWAPDNVKNTQPSQETIDMCKDVLDGNLWVFGRDDILSHASHSGTDIYQTQSGVKGSESYASFYYDDLGRTQTFYASGELTEESKRLA